MNLKYGNIVRNDQSFICHMVNKLCVLDPLTNIT